MTDLIQSAREKGRQAKQACTPATNIITIINDHPRQQKSKRLMIPISQGELDAAHNLAQSLGISTSYLVRELLKTAIESPGQPIPKIAGVPEPPSGYPEGLTDDSPMYEFDF
jgi:hypothetical protein